jgi:hypothetical protein
MGYRLVRKLVDSAAPAAGTTTVFLGLPSDVKQVTLHVKATTAAGATVDAKIQQGTPDQSVFTDIATVAIDQIPASQTGASRLVSWGSNPAISGTGMDSVATIMSIFQRLSYTLVGTVTDLKIWIEAERG